MRPLAIASPATNRALRARSLGGYVAAHQEERLVHREEGEDDRHSVTSELTLVGMATRRDLGEAGTDEGHERRIAG
jgi:hypothetical protein